MVDSCVDCGTPLDPKMGEGAGCESCDELFCLQHLRTVDGAYLCPSCIGFFEKFGAFLHKHIWSPCALDARFEECGYPGCQAKMMRAPTLEVAEAIRAGTWNPPAIRRQPEPEPVPQSSQKGAR